MAKAVLTRLVNSGKYGAFGVITVNGIEKCVSLEPPELGNISLISCIPADIYDLEWFESSKYGRTLRVKNVPKRYNIEFHWGNLLDDTEGCILPGERFGTLSSKRGVLNSLKAFRSFLYAMDDGQNNTLEIREAY